jgi:hypothetical protein
MIDTMLGTNDWNGVSCTTVFDEIGAAAIAKLQLPQEKLWCSEVIIL